ncbi:SAF domain-containing protein [Cryptosporangium sp. NPDC048952]|uniref:SAF domain-containing protein n=1 Tax=Cryptosporangium sp. NPDC048952 TaxID=3363961 RepID=UPI0037188E4B
MTRPGTELPSVGASPRTEPVAAPKGRGPRQVSRRLLLVAVLMVAGGGLLAGVAFVAVTSTDSYLTVRRDIAAGEAVQAADLQVVQLSGEVPAVRAADRGAVVGKRARASLWKGQLVPPGGVTGEPLLVKGQRQVGIALEPGRMPADRLRPGDKLLLVETPDPKLSAAKAAEAEAAALGPWDATVVGGGSHRETDGDLVVYVAVADADAERIGKLAAAGRLVVLLQGAR